MRHLNVLIACEESQAECEAFRNLGHKAYSCDIQKCRRGGHPEWHIHGDVTPYLEGRTQFWTQDGKHHHISKWHLIIAHPPCTYLCRISSTVLYKEGTADPDRLAKMEKAREFFMKCLNAKAPHVAVENPIPMKRANLPKPDCFVEPFWFGHKYSKKTLYWLRNLPPIMADTSNPDYRSYVHCSRGKYRSRTFEGVAKALAKQWGDFVAACQAINYDPDKMKELDESYRLRDSQRRMR